MASVGTEPRRVVTVSVNAHEPSMAKLLSAPALPLPHLEDRSLRRAERDALGRCILPEPEIVARARAEGEAVLEAGKSAEVTKGQLAQLERRYPFLREAIPIDIAVAADGRVEEFNARDVDPEMATCIKKAMVGQYVTCPPGGQPVGETVALLPQ